jgi:hypothetical protein
MKILVDRVNEEIVKKAMATNLASEAENFEVRTIQNH